MSTSLTGTSYIKYISIYIYSTVYTVYIYFFYLEEQQALCNMNKQSSAVLSNLNHANKCWGEIDSIKSTIYVSYI